MSDSLFNEQMSSYEARTVLFRAVEGKTKEETEELLADYDKVHSNIMERELRLVSKGIITE